jgi:hypothetical protein
MRMSMFLRSAPIFLLLFSPGTLLCQAQTPAPAPTTPPTATAAPPSSSADASETTVDDILKETQRTVGGKDLTGLVWWVPAEFWEQSAIQQGSSAEQARSTFAPLRQYTMVIILAGKVGLGNVNWYSENDIRSNTSLRDSEGQTYKPLTEISADATGVASIIKPIMANILGPTGQNLQILFFASRTAAGRLIADPGREGRFAVVIENIAGPKPLNFEWLLPLTSLTPPKFCPVGKERVEANWKYCPWHGVKLPDNLPPAPPVFQLLELKPKDSKPQ